MAWDAASRHQHRRESTRYPSDMTDREWTVIGPLLPPPKPGGRPRRTDLRAVMNAILSIASGGCPWRMLPKDFPPRSTVQGSFDRWRDSQGDDQPPPGPEHAGAGRARRQPDRRCHRQPKCEDERERRARRLRRRQEEGRKRHIVTDTLGLMLIVLVHGADGQDRDGAPALLTAIRHRYPWLRHIFADGGSAGEKLRTALQGHGVWTLEIVQRSDPAEGFEVLPRRWVVERTFAWLGRCRRLAKDWEKTTASSTAWALIASIRLISRRLARYCFPT
jgi:putative transposase